MRINGLTFDYFATAAVPQRAPLDSKPITFWAAGLGGEVAEFSEVVLALLNLAVASGNVNNLTKKFERDQPALVAEQKELDDKIRAEAGNVLFYLNLVLQKRGLSLNEAAVSQLHVLDRMTEAGTS